MLVSTRGAILGRYFKTEKQAIKYLEDTEKKYKQFGIKLGPKYYDSIAVLGFKDGVLLTTKQAVEKMYAKNPSYRGTGTHATNEKTVPNDSVDKTHGIAKKRSKRDSGNYKKPSK